MNNSTEITNLIIETINAMFSSIFSSIDDNLNSVLDSITFVDESIINTPYFSNIFGLSSTSGILLISNALILGFLLFYCTRFYLSHYGIVQTESPLVFISKVLLYGIIMNCSLFICEKILFFNNEISNGILSIGKDIFNLDINFSNLINLLNSVIFNDNTTFTIFSIDGILKSFISTGLLTLTFSYSIRYIMIKIFILISPFAFLSLCTSATSSLFKAWIKGFFSLILIQILISLILVLIFSLNPNSSTLLSKILLCGGLFSLMKANSYIYSLFGGINTEFANGINGFKNILKNY